MRWRTGFALTSFTAALLVGACTSSSSATDTAASASRATHPDTIARPGPRPGVGVGQPDTARVPAASRERRDALSVAVWKPGSAEACGLPTAGTGGVRLFFACTPRSGPVIPAVPARSLSVPAGANAKESAIAALLRGPTAAERQAGLLSNFGERSAGTPFTLRMRGDTAVLDLDPRIRDVPMIFVGRNDVAQLVATLGQFSDVRQVVILVGGAAMCKVVGEC